MTELTVPANDRLAGPYTATDGQTVFAYDFPIFAAADLVVARRRSDVETTLAPTTDYTVTGAGEQAGGTIVLTAGAEAGDIIAIYGVRAVERPGDLQPPPNAPTAADLNAELDRLQMQLQELRTQVARAVRLAATDAADDLRLPLKTVRQGAGLGTVAGYDAEGKPRTYPVAAVNGSVVASTWLVGAGAPPNETGQTGDMWLDTYAGNVYGPKTAEGWTGPIRNIFGPGAGLGYVWDAGTADADPGAGKVRGNNATLASATVLYISKTGAAGESLGAVIATWDDSLQTDNRGHLSIYTRADRAEFIEASISGALVDGPTSTYWKVPIAVHAAAGTPDAGEAMAVVFSRTGDSGQIAGSTGPDDNHLLRADGTGGATAQPSAAAVDDSGNLSTPGSVKSSGAGGIGYATGAGGTVTQGTSKSTTVTLNKVSGQITMHNAELAAGAEASFTVNNSAVEPTDVIAAVMASGGTVGAYRVAVHAVGSGAFVITITNVGANPLSEAVVINFVVIKGASS